jgi:hypothetical protein
MEAVNLFPTASTYRQAYRKHGASPKELWALLVSGGEIVGWESLGSIKGLFKRGG